LRIYSRRWLHLEQGHRALEEARVVERVPRILRRTTTKKVRQTMVVEGGQEAKQEEEL
jgi:hypothetical protein